jgi:ketosteroid isomerase-like protein
MNPIETVQQIYAAFGRGDIAFILAQLADDVDWEHDNVSPVPWLQPLKGRAQVPRFFDALMSHVEITEFVPTFVAAQGNTVVSLVDLKFTVRATGRPVVEPDEVHIWRFNTAGQVQRFRHRADTWLSVQALQKG